MTYEKHIRALQLEREYTQGKVCRNAEHHHIAANTFSCLRSAGKLPLKVIINHYQKN
jgi:ketopantoate reductase